MPFKKGNIPYNKSNDLIFDIDFFLYKDKKFEVKEIQKLYLEDNIQKTELSNLLNIPIHKLNKIFEQYNLWKPKILSNKNVIKSVDYSHSVEKQKNTKLERYGDVNYNNRLKYKETCLQRYGESNIFKTAQFKSNMIKLNRQKYGCDWNSQSEEIKNKKLKTCQEHFGVNCSFQAEKVKEKIKNTNINKIGVEYPTQNPDILKKQKETNLRKYNREYGFDYEKSKKYYMNTFGVEYYTQTQEFHKKSKKHYIYENETFDSFPELCVFIYAKENNISIERCPVKFEYSYNQCIHYYFPDFKYDGRLIEIKGNHFFENNKMINPYDRTQDDKYDAKYKCGLEHHVEFWLEKDYKFALDYFKNRGYKKLDYEN